MGEIILRESKVDFQNLKPSYDESKSLSENAKEAVKFTATVNTLKDALFVETVENEIKETIKDSVVSDRKIEHIEKQSRVIDSETVKANSYFSKHKAILEFGGIDNPCVISVMKLTFCIMVAPYFLTAIAIKTPLRIIATMFDEFNKFLVSIGNFSKLAKLFCQFIIWTSLAAVIIFVLLLVIECIFKIKIF